MARIPLLLSLFTGPSDVLPFWGSLSFALVLLAALCERQISRMRKLIQPLATAHGHVLTSHVLVPSKPLGFSQPKISETARHIQNYRCFHPSSHVASKAKTSVPRIPLKPHSMEIIVFLTPAPPHPQARNENALFWLARPPFPPSYACARQVHGAATTCKFLGVPVALAEGRGAYKAQVLPTDLTRPPVTRKACYKRRVSTLHLRALGAECLNQ